MLWAIPAGMGLDGSAAHLATACRHRLAVSPASASEASVSSTLWRYGYRSRASRRASGSPAVPPWAPGCAARPSGVRSSAGPTPMSTSSPPPPRPAALAATRTWARPLSNASASPGLPGYGRRQVERGDDLPERRGRRARHGQDGDHLQAAELGDPEQHVGHQEEPHRTQTELRPARSPVHAHPQRDRGVQGKLDQRAGTVIPEVQHGIQASELAPRRTWPAAGGEA